MRRSCRRKHRLGPLPADLLAVWQELASLIAAVEAVAPPPADVARQVAGFRARLEAAARAAFLVQLKAALVVARRPPVVVALPPRTAAGTWHRCPDCGRYPQSRTSVRCFSCAAKAREQERRQAAAGA